MKKACFAFSIAGLLLSCTPKEEQHAIQVERISIDQTDMTLEEGESTTLTATVWPEEAEDKTVKWSSSDESVVMASSAGKVMAMTVGKAVITAQAGEAKDFISVTVIAHQNHQAPTVTIGADNVSAISAILKGKVNPETVSGNLKLGFQYSTASDFPSSGSVTVEVSEYDDTYHYSAGITGLNPATTYYFRSFIKNSGQYSFGATKEFATRQLASLIETCGHTDVHSDGAVLNAKLDLTDVQYTSLEYGFYWGTTETSQETALKGTDLKDHLFSAPLSGLSQITNYWYKAYVQLDGKLFYGAVNSFITAGVSVAGISLDATAVTVKVGETITLTPTITPPNASNKNVVWSIADEEVASVEDGTVTGIQPGSTYVVATTEDGGFKADCAVTVVSNLAPSVTVGAERISAISACLKGKANLESTTSADLTIGIQYSKSSGILPANSITVEATDPDSNYNYAISITGLDPATTYYFRSFVRQNGLDTYGETKDFRTKDLSSMLHTQEASAVSAVSAQLNSLLDLTDVLFETREAGFYWGESAQSLENKLIASDAPGTAWASLTGLTPAQEYFFQPYLVLDGRSFQEEVMSFTAKDLSSMLETLEATDVSATAARLNARLDLTDVAYKDIAYGFYLGSDSSLLDTDLKGEALTGDAYAVPLTDLSHKTQYWYQAYAVIDNQSFLGTVKSFTTDVVPVESVSLDQTELHFNTIGSSCQLTATVLPDDATDKRVTWTSSKESVATITSSGLVKAVGNGEAVITASNSDGKKMATCAVTVKQLVTEVVLDAVSLSMNEGQMRSLTATVKPNTAYDKSLTWTSSNTAVATVDASGRVTAVSKGTATIKAKANDDSGKYATCTVTVKRLVSSITLDRTSITMYRRDVDVTEKITHTVVPSDANNTAVLWTSSNNSVASVSYDGRVTGKAPGKATIEVWADDGSNVHASCEVEVRQYVTGIDLWAPSIAEGKEFTISPTISPANANDKSLSWTSSDESVATIDENGKVTAISKGSATITATAKDGSGTTASCSFTVKRLVTAITLDKTSISMERGKNDVTETIIATVTPSDASNTSVSWSSSDLSVAKVSSEGVVTGLARGNAVITARASDGSGVSAQCAVEIYQYVAGITLSETSLTLKEGQIQTVTATVAPATANDKTITWLSLNPSVATVDNTGKITAVSKGSTAIRVTANDGSGESSTCYVTVNRPVVSISLDKSSLTISRGKTNVKETLIATVAPSDASNTSVIWSSSDWSVASVSYEGVVTGLARGNAIITATSADDKGLKATCAVEVKQNVTGITLTQTELTLNEGQKQSLAVQAVTPADANDPSYTWISFNPSIATVDENGIITAVSKGATAIRAEANDGGGAYASCSVTVKRPVESIALDRTSLFVYNGKTETITATLTPSDASNTAVTWASSDMSVATVSSSGVITGVTRGNAVITATAVGGSNVKASCNVEVRQYVTGITLDKTSIVLNAGKEQTLAVTGITPDNVNDKTVIWSSSNPSIATVNENGNITAISEGKVTITATANDGSGVSASCNVRVIPKEAVDFGLSVYWASCNLGSNGFVASPEDYGTFFAWGETSSNRNTWAYYKWYNSNIANVTKYNSYAKTSLELEDDAAHVILGGKWRMPTKAEWQELLNNCDYGWQSQNGQDGLLLTSRKTGESIFLPAAGSKENTTIKGMNTSGNYWSSSVNTRDFQYAWGLNFFSGVASMSTFIRCYGYSIRPVMN